MRDDLKYNMYNYYNKNNDKKIIITLIIIIMILLFLFISYNEEIVSVNKVTGQCICNNEDCSLLFYYPKNLSFQKIEFNNNIYNIDDLNISKENISLNDEYEEIILSSNKISCSFDEVVNINLHSSKEKIIKKIVKIILER